jgi:hypothetical protein
MKLVSLLSFQNFSCSCRSHDFKLYTAQADKPVEAVAADGDCRTTTFSFRGHFTGFIRISLPSPFRSISRTIYSEFYWYFCFNERIFFLSQENICGSRRITTVKPDIDIPASRNIGFFKVWKSETILHFIQ